MPATTMSLFRLQPATEQLPKALLGQPTHLDPDFEVLTFGDQGRRGNRISMLSSGDLLAFFATLRPVDRPPRAAHLRADRLVCDRKDCPG
jgi:Nucleotide modification associated domain 3